MDQDLFFGILASSLAFILLVAGIITALFVGNRKRLQAKMRITELELSYEKELRKAESEISEQMMERFAQELHDNIGHTLTYIRMQIENSKLDDPGLEDSFRPIERYLDDASQQLRLLSRSLNTDYVSDLGLNEAIRFEVERLVELRRHTIDFQTSNPGICLDKNQALMAFRIFQEMIHNAIRHSKARNLRILLTDEDGFRLAVTDDGRGFNVAEILQSPKASGLRNIVRRAQMAGLRCNIESAPGQGCSYVLTAGAGQSDL